MDVIYRIKYHKDPMLSNIIKKIYDYTFNCIYWYNLWLLILLQNICFFFKIWIGLPYLLHQRYNNNSLAPITKCNRTLLRFHTLIKKHGNQELRFVQRFEERKIWLESTCKSHESLERVHSKRWTVQSIQPIIIG